MEATSDYKNKIKNLFEVLEPEGKGKVHKDTLKKNMKKMLLGGMMDDKEMDQMIENMNPDKDGMISIKSYLKLFSMPQFSAEEAAATRSVLKERPELVEELMDSKSLAAKMGYNNPQEVEKIVDQLKKCYLENLDRRLQREPPKNKKVVLEKQAQILKAVAEQASAQQKEKEANDSIK